MTDSMSSVMADVWVLAVSAVDPGFNPQNGLNGDPTSSMTDAVSTFANLDDNSQNLPTGFL